MPNRAGPDAVAGRTDQPQTLAERLPHGDTAVLDLTPSVNSVKCHIPGAFWASRAQLPQALAMVPPAERCVLICGTSQLARLAVAEVEAITGKPVLLQQAGTLNRIAEKPSLEEGETHLASPRIDRYRRSYEGTDSPKEVMQACLDWEFGLVDQLAHDGTHGFYVI